jgi:hypothetical protein
MWKFSQRGQLKSAEEPSVSMLARRKDFTSMTEPIALLAMAGFLRLQVQGET